MQVDGALQGGSTRPRRRRLNVLLAIVAILVIAAVVALMVWAAPLATSGAGAEAAVPKPEASWVTLYDAEGNPHRIHLRTGWAGDAAPWVVLYDAEVNAHLVSAP